MKIYIRKASEKSLHNVLLKLFQNRLDIWEDVKKGIDGYEHRFWEEMMDEDKEKLTVDSIISAMCYNVYHNRYTGNEVGWNSRIISLSAGQVDYQVNDRNCEPFILGWDCLSDEKSDDSDISDYTHTVWVYCSCDTVDEGRDLVHAGFKPQQVANKIGLPGYLQDYYNKLEKNGISASQW